MEPVEVVMGVAEREAHHPNLQVYTEAFSEVTLFVAAENGQKP
jgi:hypothetical protein